MDYIPTAQVQRNIKLLTQTLVFLARVEMKKKTLIEEIDYLIYFKRVGVFFLERYFN